MTYYSISALVNAFVSIILGLFVVYKKFRFKLNRNLFFWCFAVFAWSSFYFVWQIELDSVKALLWTKLLMVGAIWAPLAYFKVVTIFLEIENQQRKLTYFGYFLSIAFTLLLFTPLMVKNVEFSAGFLFWPKPGLAYAPFLVMFLGYTFYGLYLSIRALKKSSPLKKTQIKFMLFGMVVSIIGGSTNYFLWYDIPIKPYGNIFASTYVLATIYAIIRHRLLDIRLFVIRSILYTLTVIIVGMLFTLFVFTLGENILGSAFWGIILGSVIISLGLEPLLHFFRRVTDRYFFQEKYNYQKTLRELVKSMTRIIDLQNLLDTVTATIKSALKVERIAMILWNGADDLPVEIKQVGFDVPLDTHFSKNKSLVKHLAQTQDELVEGELKIEMERGRLKIPMEWAESIVREMRNLDIAVCFPIIANERLIGVLALGNKQSGDVFSNDDIQLLNTFSSQASIAIVNAQLYQEVKDFNAKLQEKIDRATEHLRQSNEELRQANIRLKELDQAKSDFLSLASHQLRAPLSITKGYASMILEGTYGPCPPEMVGPLTMIFDGNERLVRFVNNLLDVSRMESGRLEYIFKDVNLSEMVQSVVKELKLAADKKKLYLELHIDSGSAIISADDEKLRQVVLNLIDNSIKYTKQGSVSVHLKKGKHNGSKAGFIFSVTDTGRGMSEADKASLFQKFSRGQGVSRIHTEGTGLGLYVASQIIQAHHGLIWAESPGKDKGSTFAFWVEGKG